MGMKSKEGKQTRLDRLALVKTQKTQIIKNKKKEENKKLTRKKINE